MFSTNKAPTNIDKRVYGGLHVVYNPGTAETLDMRDEGETAGFLPGKPEFHPGCACPIIKKVNTSSLLGGTNHHVRNGHGRAASRGRCRVGGGLPKAIRQTQHLIAADGGARDEQLSFCQHTVCLQSMYSFSKRQPALMDFKVNNPKVS